MLRERVTGSEIRRRKDDDARPVDCVKRELGITVLEHRRIQFIDGKETVCSTVSDTRPRRREMPIRNIQIRIYSYQAYALR